MSYYFAIYALVTFQNAETPSISTPDLSLEAKKEQSLQKDLLRNAEVSKPFLSPNVLEPTPVNDESIETYDKVKSRFDSIASEAQLQKAVSFINLLQKVYLPQGCIIAGDHPTGVKRLVDGNYNGSALLIDCDNVFYNIEYMDFSQKLEQGISKELSSKFYAINGGYLSQSIARSSDGRIRRDLTAIGVSSSVDMVAQSKVGIDYSSNDLLRDIKIIESLLKTQ